ncbi:MAG: hypothetical protein J5871_04330, partial [Bacteroidales bacterium]|nr:hypothetical protein [Bacteroidales bacterium]
EAYRREAYRHYLEDVGFDLLYDKSGMYDILRGLVQGGRQARELTWNWQFLGPLQPRMLCFLENHDEQRLASPWFAGSASRGWAALAAAALFNTAPLMLYFGQEVGEDAAEGAEGRTSIFDNCRPEGITALHAHVHGKLSLTGDKSFIYNKYREVISLAASPLFRRGKTWDLCYCNEQAPGFDPARHFVFLRYLDSGEQALVFCNFSDAEAAVSIRLAPEFGGGTVSLQAAPWDFQIRHTGRG